MRTVEGEVVYNESRNFSFYKQLKLMNCKCHTTDCFYQRTCGRHYYTRPCNYPLDAPGFINNYYFQFTERIDALAMGFPTKSSSDAHLQTFNQQIIVSPNIIPKLYRPYVDDIFAIWLRGTATISDINYQFPPQI